MKVVFEVENEQDVKSMEKIMKKIRISDVKKQNKYITEQKVNSILEFANQHAIKVSKVEIPSREERNAR